MNATDLSAALATFELVEIDRLKPHPNNPRQGDVGAIVESIRKIGFRGAITAQRSTGIIVAGEHRWRAARSLGMTHVPVKWEDMSDEEAESYMLADNRTSDLASYDNVRLYDLLSARAERVDGLEGTGYDESDVEDLRRLLEEPVTFEPNLNPETTVKAYTDADIAKAEARLNAPPKERKLVRVVCPHCAGDFHIEPASL